MAGCCGCDVDDYAGYRSAMRDVLALDSDPAAMRHLPLRVHFDTSPPIQMPIAPLRDGMAYAHISSSTLMIWLTCLLSASCC